MDGLAGKLGSWLILSEEVRGKCLASDALLDALVAALVAQAAARGLCEPIAADDWGLAKVEGWNALPAADGPGGLNV